VASAPEQLALLVLAHLLPALLDDAAQRLIPRSPLEGGGEWLVGRGGEVNRAGENAHRDPRARDPRTRPARTRPTVSENHVLRACVKCFWSLIRFRGRNFKAHHLDFFVIVS
jgi:hypothetical protein